MSGIVATMDRSAVTAATDDRSQYVNFTIDCECFAFAMQSVREIIRMPDTVAVPLTTRSLVGLANLRGSVIPVLSLRGLLHLPERDATESSRVLVIDHGRPVGLVVDRVASVMSVDRTDVESAANIQTTLESEVLAGAVRNQQGWDLVLLLDPSRVLEGEFGSLGKTAGGGAAIGDGLVSQASQASGQDAGEGTEASDADDGTRQMVSFLVDGQEYAFPIARVEEIVRVPETISQVPNADSTVFGIINLRQRLLPLLGLRRLFGLPDAGLNEDSRIVVVRLSETETVGIIVDQVREVLRVRQTDLDDVPPQLFQGSDAGELESVCRLDDGRRLVSILSVDAMFHHPSVQEGLARQGKAEAGETKVIEENTSANAGNSDALTENIQLVVFRLDAEEYGVAITLVQEIIRLPAQFSKVPKTAAFIDGLANLRGAVLPVVDLRERLGIARKMDRDDRQRIMVLNLGGVQTGFVVDSVTEVLRLPGSEIEAAPAMSPEQARMMGSVANMRKDGRMILLLDPRYLLDRSERSEIQELAEIQGLKEALPVDTPEQAAPPPPPKPTPTPTPTPPPPPPPTPPTPPKPPTPPPTPPPPAGHGLQRSESKAGGKTQGSP